MPFSEKIKLIAKQNSAFRCCICHKPFVEIHHIIPQSEGGNDTLENAAPLCASCHDLYGENPGKRKIIRQMRNHWWQLMQKRASNIIKAKDIKEDDLHLEPNHNFESKLSNKKHIINNKKVIIYHTVFENENFETSAQILFKLVKEAQMKFPNKERILFLDIEGHRNSDGGFDPDMFELIKDFSLGFLMAYLTELHTPLMRFKNSDGI